MLKRCLRPLLALVVFLTIIGGYNPVLAADYYRIAVISDLHLPNNKSMLKLQDPQMRETILQAKLQAIADVDSWEDVGLIAITGDIVGTNGSAEEFAFVKQVFSNIKKPLAPILGNHDLMYGDTHKGKWTYTYNDAAARQMRIDAFKQVFKLKKTYYTKQVNGYNLIFLSPDVLDKSVRPILLSDTQLNWLDDILSNNKQPAIIFCHAPLSGTFRLEDVHTANPADDSVKPADKISALIKKHPQIIMWVSGHLHMSAKVASFKSPVNLYQDQVMNIHNSDMNRRNIYTRSLYLYEDKVVVKTFAHKTQKFVDKLELSIKIPDRLK